MATKTNPTLLFQRLVPAYRKGVFKAMHERLGIIICYSAFKRKNGFGEDLQLPFPSECLRKIQLSKSETNVLQFPLRVLLKYKPKVVISEGSPSYATLWLLLFWRFFFRYKLILWTHGVKNSERETAFQGFSGKIRLFLLNRADGVLVYSETRKNQLAASLKNPKKIAVAWNTLDTDTELATFRELKQLGKQRVKEELGWKKQFNLIFLGRLVEAKNLHTALHVLTNFRFGCEFGIHIIGDGPERIRLQEQFSSHSNLVFYGAEFDQKRLGKFLFASDLMFIPGQIGLSIVHAFCYGCPVIGCLENNSIPIAHGPELAYLIPGYNGFLVGDCEKDLGQEINEILLNKDLNLLAENAQQTIEEKATLKKMLDGFEYMLAFVRKEGL